MDTTYIPIAKGFAYLGRADWTNRRVLAGQGRLTLEAYHTEDVLEQALRL